MFSKSILLLSAVLWMSVAAAAQDRVTSYRVVDGDTIHATVDVGYETQRNIKIRISGIWSAESWQPDGERDRKALALALDGKRIQFSPHRTRTGNYVKSFDRYVGDLFADGVLVSSLLSEAEDSVDSKATSAGERTSTSDSTLGTGSLCASLPDDHGGSSGSLTTPLSTTPWQESIQAEINAAAWKSSWSNLTVTVTIPEGVYEFVSLVIPGHVYLRGTGEGRSVRLRYVGEGNATLVTLLPGYAKGLSNIEILSKNPDAPNLTAVSIEGAINSEIRNFRFAHRGPDSTGIAIKGRESTVVSDVDVRCTTPIRYAWGDNIQYHNCDLGSYGRSVVVIEGMPNQITFDGYQTWQGGESAVYGVVDSPRTGQGLNIYNLRYEQSTGRDTVAAIDLRFVNRGLENLVIMGSRWTDRKYSFDTRGVQRLTVLGSYTPGVAK